MKHEDFNIFLDEIVNKMRQLLASKSSDYSTINDKLFNFKLQARVDGCTPAEALRGNFRKHLASLIQGMDELKTGRCRSLEWWQEKGVDAINYIILLLAMVRTGEWK